MSKHILRHLLERRAGFDSFAAAGQQCDTTTFLAPSQPLSGCTDKKTGIWYPPRASIASRIPASTTNGSSRSSCRGRTVDHEANREIVFESRLEERAADILMARRDVARLVDQPSAVRYQTPDGAWHRHTFDFMTVTNDGMRIAIAVKPEARVAKSGIQETLKLIRRQVGAKFADHYLVRTERHITPTAAHNAALILRSRRGRNDEDVTRVHDLVRSLSGAVLLGDLVFKSDMGARGLNALICLIDDGVLEPTVKGRIDHLTPVRLVGTR